MPEVISLQSSLWLDDAIKLKTLAKWHAANDNIMNTHNLLHAGMAWLACTACMSAVDRHSKAWHGIQKHTDMVSMSISDTSMAVSKNSNDTTVSFLKYKKDIEIFKNFEKWIFIFLIYIRSIKMFGAINSIWPEFEMV